MKTLTSKINRKAIALLLLLIGGLAFYFQLKRLGYIPPLNYLLNAQENLTQKDLHTAVPGNQQLNYNRAIAEIIPSTTIDLSKTSILLTLPPLTAIAV
ncbi:hypothetical protein HC931_21275 [Candidatus Gracilibacteria bacterium]|nr:hypothetical protein [Candidatus Gracilibacteria bacterium]NJM89977.1 hypothetical protein [Hydrococcus sp. RU_2_2]NJP20353.1 hypothetical protein [Hydrococcus sp. CRU_1_1]NJQ97926.1 hypothetical protein [Hydrococcus sp. CSU_1_8]